MLHSFSILRRRRLGVRKLAAAFWPHLVGIVWINRAFRKGASKLSHSKGFASGKKFTAFAADGSAQETRFFWNHKPNAATPVSAAAGT
jgi:hypothetical protein